MKYCFIMALYILLGLQSCSESDNYDASGNFEADEVIVSAQQNGEILSFTLNEGDQLHAGQVVGQIDITLPQLQKAQVQASINSLKEKTSTPYAQVELIRKQLTVQESQLKQQYREQKRTVNLLKADAATPKQLDDINARIEQLQQEIAVTRQQVKLSTSNVASQNRGITSEKAPLEATLKQFDEQINRGKIINPITGLVLTKYALKGEIAVAGKPLYKIANLDTLTLKAYLTGDKLASLKIGQPVKVRIDYGKDSYKNYKGILTWISGKAEFTPKTIQTKNERANLVYAIKVSVKNDGFLKIGMYGEVFLTPEN
jgi:HlyD family secretion protein